MALLHCNFFSETLGVSTSMDVILPQATLSQIGMRGATRAGLHPTLYLLHGLSDDHTIWQRRTSIERYVAALGLAVVMPGVQRSFYTDMHKGYRYWTFISEEIPALARSFFPLSPRREDNFVAGLSMGGYGAFKLALRCPGRFAAAASLSGALDMATRIEDPARDPIEDIPLIFGDPPVLRDTENDLFECARRAVAAGATLPRLYQWCGTEDYLHADNVRFRDHALGLGLDLTYEESPGAHEWACWDRAIQNVIAWLPLETPAP